MKYIAPLLFCCAIALGACKSTKTDNGTDAGNTVDNSVPVCSVKFSADSAFAHVEAQCAFGPRVPNSTAIEQCGDYIETKFKSYGLTVENQRTTLTAWDGTTLKCRNIIARFRPEATSRVIICSHYDSRPWADNDPDEANRHKPVMAANDGASGVAVMLEMARLMKDVDPKVGVDFICFDAEDYGVPDWADEAAQAKSSDSWCMGSTYWAKNLKEKGYARYGVLLDMVGGRGTTFSYEGFSMQRAKDVVNRTWNAAARANAGHLFKRANGSYITDDHVPMYQYGLVPTIDIIAFNDGSDGPFPATWHTVNDTPENIDPAVLRGVGQTLLQLLSEEE